MADTGEGPLSSQAWNEVTFHHVHLAFLRAEWHKLPIKTGPADRRLVEYPNLTENAETSRRTQLVYSWRAPLMTQVPGDTRWYEVRYLEERHLNELLVIGRCGWDDPPDGNEITKVAVYRTRFPGHS